MRDAACRSLAVGFFDGVHRGHQAILAGADVALTFRNHPLSVLAPEKAPRLIMTCEERVAAIKSCGVKDVIVLDFTPELAEVPAEEFVRRYLASSVSGLPSSIRCGENWRFGKNGAGDAAFLRARGIDVKIVPYAEYQGERISSSRIRMALERGEIEDANAMMGRRYQVSGNREQGKGLGRQIGYPTVNLHLSTSTSHLHLPFGVYEVEVEGRRAIANYGLAPTMGARAWTEPVLEMHFVESAGIEDGRRETADETVVSVIRFIRPERKFNTIDDLKRQIAADCATIGA